MTSFTKNGIRTINFTLFKKDIKKLRMEWKHYVQSFADYSADKFHGRGIVMCAGKIKYFTCCWISIKVLRRKRCSLPIEVWYMNDELSNDVKKALHKMNVVCKNAADFTTEKLTRYALKPFSILNSSFSDVLYLDADNICMENPEDLFSLSEYEKFGAVFWPDFWETELSNPIWEIIGINPTNSPEQESGQLLINKEKCWKELNLCLFFNLKGNVYYHLLYGDKDTFRFAWLALKKEFFMVEKNVSICGYEDENSDFHGVTMIQHVEDRPFFLHRNLLKWDITLLEERVWKKIKQFYPNTKSKVIILRKNYRTGHNYLDIEGSYQTIICDDAIQDLEEICMQILKQLRKSSFYGKFLNFCYILEKRSMS